MTDIAAFVMIILMLQGEASKEPDSTGAILQQLVTLLTAAEQEQLYASAEPPRPSPSGAAQTGGGGGREDEGPKEGRREGNGQVQYHAGDLGLLPRPPRKARPPTPDK